MFFFAELTCPANCNNAGRCDTSTSKCSCDSGKFGIDCSVTTTTTTMTTTSITSTTVDALSGGTMSSDSKGEYKLN